MLHHQRHIQLYQLIPPPLSVGGKQSLAGKEAAEIVSGFHICLTPLTLVISVSGDYSFVEVLCSVVV